MANTTTTTTRAPDDVAELAALQRVLGPWALLGWRPRRGFTDPGKVDLPRIALALRELVA